MTHILEILLQVSSRSTRRRIHRSQQWSSCPRRRRRRICARSFPRRRRPCRASSWSCPLRPWRRGQPQGQGRSSVVCGAWRLLCALFADRAGGDGGGRGCGREREACLRVRRAREGAEGEAQIIINAARGTPTWLITPVAYLWVSERGKISWTV